MSAGRQRSSRHAEQQWACIRVYKITAMSDSGEGIIIKTRVLTLSGVGGEAYQTWKRVSLTACVLQEHTEGAMCTTRPEMSHLIHAVNVTAKHGHFD